MHAERDCIGFVAITGPTPMHVCKPRHPYRT